MIASKLLTPPASDVQVPMEQVGTFVRQLTHDIRNGLNAIDLQAAYALELSGQSEAADEIKRMRAQIQQSARSLQSLSAHFWAAEPSIIPYSAAIFVEDLRQRLGKQNPEMESRVVWEVKLTDETIGIDIEMIFAAMAEIFRNALHFGDRDSPVSARISAEEGSLSIEVAESKAAMESDPSDWGVAPFRSTRRGGYGLGLFRVRQILAAHNGSITFYYDSGCALLTTRVRLPLVV